MNTLSQQSADYARIEKAILFLEQNAARQPDLKEVASQVRLSEYHFQRLFTRWAGISPKRFLQFLTKENARHLLARSSVLDATIQAGLSGPGRLHHLLVQTEGATPGEIRSRGEGMQITYGFHPSPFGECLLALSERGICFLGFVQGNDPASLLGDLRRDWANATLLKNVSRTRPVVEKIFAPQPGDRLTLHLRGTNFQIKVWEALLRLPPEAVTSYEALAEQAGTAGAARAVGNALANNPVAYLIPCHRVLQKAGAFGNYRYGSQRKQAILLREDARRYEEAEQ